MKLIRNTFVAVADDCPAATAEVPPLRGPDRTLARLHYDLLSGEPYRLTLDELDWNVELIRKAIPQTKRDEARSALLAKGRPCMRASPLTKRYGWGAHHDADGRLAIMPREGERYRELLAAPGLHVTKAIRSKRA